MPVPAAQLLFDERIVTAKKHKLYFIADAQTIAVSTFQRRTGHDGIFSGGKQLLDLFAQTIQPRPSIFIGQRMTVAHLFDICLPDEIIVGLEASQRQATSNTLRKLASVFGRRSLELP